MMDKKSKYEIPSLGEVLKDIALRDYFPTINRPAFTDYSAEECLQIVEVIGKKRSAKFRIDSENRFAYLNFIRWANGDEAMQALDPDTGKVVPGNLKKGIFIGGTIGSGKSWCLDIMQVYCRKMGLQVHFSENYTPKSLSWESLRASTICDNFAQKGDIREYARQRILAVQDLGNEPVEALNMGNRCEVMRSILEYRGDFSHKCLTLITSNLKMTGANLTERYGNRVTSRLREMCNYFEIKGQDRRKL